MNTIQSVILVTGGVVVVCGAAIAVVIWQTIQLVNETQASIDDAHEEFDHNSSHTSSRLMNWRR